MRRLGTIWALALFLCAAGGPTAGQFSGFGKNKVQYEDFEWHRIETPHFDIYFYPEEEELAGYAAHMAERQFVDLEKKFGHAVERRVPLVIYSSHIYFQQTNIIPNLLPEGVAGFTEWLKGRVAMPLSGSLPDFERVLHHELVHVFMFDRISRVLKRHGVRDFRPAPLWFSEGLAEYWSSEWDSYADMIIRDALFADRLVPIARMYLINGTFQMYKEGQSICEFMAETYGEDVFALLLDNWWRGETFDAVFKATTGDDLADFDRKWQYSLRKRYLPDISAADAPGETAEQLTRRGFNLKARAVPGDSSAYVYITNEAGVTFIAKGERDGGPIQPLTPGAGSPDFESLHPLSTKLAVSPDGKYLAFSAKRRANDHLFIWDIAARRQVRALQWPAVVAIASPTWSPDGSRIAFSGNSRGGMTDLYIADATSGTLERLTDDLYDDKEPDWSPDGGRIAFSSDRWEGGRDGYYNLFAYDIESQRIEPLTHGWHNDLQPDWSPDGERIAFSSDRDTMYNLYVATLREGGSEIHRRTRVLTGAFDPAWLNDGEGLFFTGYEGGGFNVYELAAADSSGTRRFEAAPEEVLAWKLEGHDLGDRFPKRKYQKKLSLDVAQSQIAQDPEFGTSGGIQLGLSDILGNDQFFFILSHIAGSNTGFVDGLNIVAGRSLLASRLNINTGFFRLNDRFSSRFGRFVRERQTGGFVELSYPFSMFHRIDTRFSLRSSAIDRNFEGRRLRGWLASNLVKYTYDSSRWIPTGPLAGTRYSFGAGQTVDFKSSRRFNYTLFGDMRRYFRLGQRSAVAVRYMGRYSHGDVPEFFSLGGSWTLRGYPWRSIWGSKMLLANHELRFPLLDRLILGFPFGNIDFSAFRGALFVDAGNAWTDDFGEWKGAFGAGARMSLGGVFVFRLDRARRTDFKSLGETRWDFFFGWDF